jgi:Hypervirulence associated proteins TUDOR domain
MRNRFFGTTSWASGTASLGPCAATQNASRGSRTEKTKPMATTFNIGDHVTWNSEAGHVSGRIVKVHTRNVRYKGYVHHASRQSPQYEIKSDKTDHVALHKAEALTLLHR